MYVFIDKVTNTIIKKFYGKPQKVIANVLLDLYFCRICSINTNDGMFAYKN